MQKNLYFKQKSLQAFSLPLPAIFFFSYTTVVLQKSFCIPTPFMV